MNTIEQCGYRCITKTEGVKKYTKNIEGEDVIVEINAYGTPSIEIYRLHYLENHKYHKYYHRLPVEISAEDFEAIYEELNSMLWFAKVNNRITMGELNYAGDVQSKSPHLVYTKCETRSSAKIIEFAIPKNKIETVKVYYEENLEVSAIELSMEEVITIHNMLKRDIDYE